MLGVRRPGVVRSELAPTQERLHSSAKWPFSYARQARVRERANQTGDGRATPGFLLRPTQTFEELPHRGKRDRVLWQGPGESRKHGSGSD